MVKKFLSMMLCFVIVLGGIFVASSKLVLADTYWVGSSSYGWYANNDTALKEIKSIMSQQSNLYMIQRFEKILYEYPLSGYFNSYKTRGCLWHCGNCGTKSTSCIDRFYDDETQSTITLNATQCYGYAKYCFYRFFSTFDSQTITLSSGFSLSNLNGVLKPEIIGSHFRAKGHSMVFLAYDSNNLYFIDANSGYNSSTGCAAGKCNNNSSHYSTECKINLRRFSYSEFVSRYSSTGVTIYAPKSTHQHSYPSNWTTVTAATCTTAGSAKRVCTGCGNTETKTLAALGHNYSNSYTVDKAATCTATGSESRHCTRCSAKTDVTTVAATGHSYQQGYEQTHPHKYYNKCNCGDFSYTGSTATINSCSLCYPVGKSTVTTNKEQYDNGDNCVEVSWSEAQRATHYKLIVYKKGSNGLYDSLVFSEDLIKTNSYNVNGLSAGQYRLYVYSYDSTRYMPDQSDFSYQISEPIDFKICSFAKYYDWTFNFDYTMKLISDVMLSDGSMGLVMKEMNRGLIDTVDVYDDGDIEHLEAPQRPGYRFAGWQTMLVPNQTVYGVTYTYYIFQAQYEPLLYSKGECMYGDINFDNVVDVRDIIRAKKMIAGIVEQHITLDLDGDSNINTVDMVNLAKFLLKKTETCDVFFDADGGTVNELIRTVIAGQMIGELPIPTRTGYDFVGWYTYDGLEVTSDIIMIPSENILAVARWSAKEYKINWNTGTGYTITVTRSSSPYANDYVGALSNGSTIYYGDVITVTYAATNGYSLKNKGITSIAVNRNVTASDIYASVSANSYTYNIAYKSSNGTNLGTATVSYNYGTTNTISPKSFTGYTSPSSQSIKWDSTTAKTITFTYSPKSVSTSQNVASGTWGIDGNTAFLTYSVSAEYRNRTSNSVQVRVVWTNTLKANYYYQRGQVFNATIGGKSTGNVTVVAYNAWGSSTSSNRTATVASEWITVPVSATQTSITISGDAYRKHSDGSLVNINESFTKSFSIPTY